MISIKEAFMLGIKSAWDNKKWVFVLYAVNVIVVWLLTIPVSSMLGKGLSFSTAATAVLDKFDLRIMGALLRNYAKGLNVGQLLLGFGVVYVLLQTLLSAGIINSLHENDRSMPRFFSAAAEYFTRFLRLVGYSILGAILLVIVFIIFSAISSAITGDAATEVPMVISFFIRVFLMVVLTMILGMIFDYARIMTVVNDFYGMTRTLKDAMLFVVMSFRKTFGLYALFSLSAFGLLAIYWLLESGLAVHSAFGVFLFVILSQIYVFAKMFIRLGFITGQYHFYQVSNTAKPGMTPEMLDNAVADYEQRSSDQKEN